MEYILAWNGVNGRVLSQNYLFTIEAKPNLSFEFDSLYYETEAGNKFYHAHGQETINVELTEDQIKECQEYCNKFIDIMDYPVQAYRDDLVYIGTMLKSAASEAGYKYVISETKPPYAFCKYESGTWQPVYCAFEETGQPHYNPSGDSSKYVKLMTKNEYDKLPERKSSVLWLNFTTNTWEDKRDLDRTKFNGKLEVRGYFEHYQMRTSGRIPAFEMATWEIQHDEAEAWLKDNTYNTPFIDAMLAEIKAVSIDKKTLCDKIIKHYDTDVYVSSGKLHGQMYNYIYRIENATSNSEIDDIVTEVYKLIGMGKIINMYSKFPPTTQAIEGDKSVILTESILYHGTTGV